nr:hypothetical protein [uncultured Mediterranean phage uvMED]
MERKRGKIMYVVTYKLPGREKTYSAKTIPLAHKEFLKNYAEAAGQVKKVNIEKYNEPNFKIVVSYPTYRDYFANLPKDMKENAAWMAGVMTDKYWDPTEEDK